MWPEGISTSKPLLLVPAEQVENLLKDVNNAVEAAYLTLGAEAEDFGLVVRFEGHQSLRPRYLGQSKSREKFASLEKHVPAADTKFPHEKPSSSLLPPKQQAIEEWRRKMELAFEVTKGKSLAAKAAKKQSREEKQGQWKADLKTAERFLGLRPPSFWEQTPPSGADWAENQAFEAARMATVHPRAIDPSQPPPWQPHKHPILISLDIECYEHDKSKITEIGLAILDTLALTDAPGPAAENWRLKMRAKHFRIREHLHMNNMDFVSGCADKFEFGKSDLIPLKEAPQIIASCYRPPFCAQDNYNPTLANSSTLAPDAQRHITLIGHDILNDIRYLRLLGYDIGNLSSHMTLLDTASLHRVYAQAWNPKSLAGIMYEFGIPAFNLHNAGNDAAYTLWVMMALSVKSASERGTKERKARVEEAKRERVKEHMAREAERVMQENQGWSSEGEL